MPKIIGFSKLLLKNPLTLWIKWVVHRIGVTSRYPLAKVGYFSYVKETVLGRYSTIYDYVSLYHCQVGDYTYLAGNSNFLNTKIGKFCSIAPGVKCGLGMHPAHTFVSTHPVFFSTACQAQVTFADKSYFNELRPVEIGNDVWIGTNAIIMDGVSIGDGAIVAAGAIVTKDVPPYAIVGGVPAKVIKYRFTSEYIEFLLAFAWWNREENWIRQNWKKWHDIKQFSQEYGQERRGGDECSTKSFN